MVAGALTFLDLPDARRAINTRPLAVIYIRNYNEIKSKQNNCDRHKNRLQLRMAKSSGWMSRSFASQVLCTFRFMNYVTQRHREQLILFLRMCYSLALTVLVCWTVRTTKGHFIISRIFLRGGILMNLLRLM